jgi:hypothetical protein
VAVQGQTQVLRHGWTDLEQLGRPEASHPKEAALGGGGPGPSEEVEDVGVRELRPELEQLVVVLHALLHDEAQVVVEQVRLQRAAELRQPLAVVVQPPRVLHVEHGGACMHGHSTCVRNQSLLGNRAILQRWCMAR